MTTPNSSIYVRISCDIFGGIAVSEVEDIRNEICEAAIDITGNRLVNVFLNRYKYDLKRAHEEYTSEKWHYITPVVIKDKGRLIAIHIPVVNEVDIIYQHLASKIENILISHGY